MTRRIVNGHVNYCVQNTKIVFKLDYSYGSIKTNIQMMILQTRFWKNIFFTNEKSVYENIYETYLKHIWHYKIINRFRPDSTSHTITGHTVGKYHLKLAMCRFGMVSVFRLSRKSWDSCSCNKILYSKSYLCMVDKDIAFIGRCIDAENG